MKSSNPNYTIQGFVIYADSRKETMINVVLLPVSCHVEKDVDIAYYFFSSKEDILKAFAILESNNIEVEI